MRSPPSLLRAVALCGLVVLAALGPACGSDEGTAAKAAPESPYAKCGRPLELDAMGSAVCSAYRRGSTRGEAAASERGATEVTRRVDDGYRLRSWVSLVLVVVAGWLGGAVIGSLAVTWNRRRRGTRYADHILEIIEREAAAVREIGEAGEPLVEELVRRIADPMGAAEKRGVELARQCRGIEPRQEDPTRRAHLAGLYRQLDAIAARLERLHVQATVWVEHVGELHGEELEVEVNQAREDLKAALEELT